MVEDGAVGPQAGYFLHYEELQGAERRAGVVSNVYLYALQLLSLSYAVEGLQVDGSEDDAGHVQGVQCVG